MYSNISTFNIFILVFVNRYMIINFFIKNVFTYLEIQCILNNHK